MGRYRKCAVMKCHDRDSLRHRFPNPKKFLYVFQRWMEVIGNEPLKLLEPSYVYKSHRVCHKHFLPTDNGTNCRLMKEAVPSRYLEDTAEDIVEDADSGEDNKLDIHIFSPVIPLNEAKRFITDCMVAVGTLKAHAQALADNLVEADYRGHFSHGMNRLEMYIKESQSKMVDGAAVPTILKETPATAWVDGNNGLGVIVGNFCMELAVQKAKSVGVGWVCAKGSNHYGIAGFYGMQAQREGLLGMSFTNTSPIVCPTRAKQAAIGTNPLCLAAPAKNDDGFVLDMATSAAALGKIEIQKRKNEPIPEGWAQDSTGQITTDASVAYDSTCLLPVGGLEINSGYKGYGLGVMVEIFCGILGGSSYGPNIRHWARADSVANLGQCFIAIDPNCFAPGFEDRLGDLLQHFRQMESIDPDKPVLVAGDPEEQHMRAVDKAQGICYITNQLDTCEQLAKRLKVAPLKPLLI